MTMLIKGGCIHTMSEQGTIVGDILVRGNRIAEVGASIDLPEEEISCKLEAKGLVVVPGLIDAHIHAGPETDERLLQSEHSSGVTLGMLWPEEEGRCQILTHNGPAPSDVYMLQPGRYTDKQLHERMIALAEEGLRISCEIHQARECRRMLQLVHSTGIRVILAHLSGCEELLEAVVMSGCPVIVGLSSSRTSSPWAMACQLEAIGAAVSVTCNWPDAKLRHLPLCAALCAREGMDRDRALHLVTTAPAAILRRSEAGCIKPGCRADLVIYDGDPLLLASSHVMTIVDGKIRH